MSETILSLSSFSHMAKTTEEGEEETNGFFFLLMELKIAHLWIPQANEMVFKKIGERSGLSCSSVGLIPG